MKIYKDPITKDTCLAHEAPEGWIEIEQAELDAIRESRRIQPDPKDAIKSQMVGLENSQLMPRATREFMLLMMDAQFTQEQLALNPGYAAVKAFDNQIKALRDQL